MSQALVRVYNDAYTQKSDTKTYASMLFDPTDLANCH